ncbi:MAG: transcriptional regulator, partial [Clostridia bacterium]|nr:transcriptional regulator [Clostridia bacterium]
YTSKGEYNDRAGNSAPSWWFGNLGQYGKKVLITINDEGSFIGGIKVSDRTLKDYRIQFGKQIRFRIFVPDTAERQGGFTLFGKNFGDYNEGIVCNFIGK